MQLTLRDSKRLITTTVVMFSPLYDSIASTLLQPVPDPHEKYVQINAFHSKQTKNMFKIETHEICRTEPP